MTQSTKPAHHANTLGTSFQNPWSQSKSLLASGQVFTKFPFEWAKTLHDRPDAAKHCVVVKPDFGRNAPDQGVIKATWLGHAGFMLQLPPRDGSNEPLRILFDPIWSERASPSQLAGPKRRLPPPCTLQELPEFHFVVTSHNHYDHLDFPTIQNISKLRGSHVQYIVPLGNKPWFISAGIPEEQIIELDWWDEINLGRRPSHQNHFNDSSCDVEFVCTPAQHTSGRGLSDQRATLWASWVVRQTVGDSTVSVYHAGDTGYMTETGPCPAFKEIGDRYGPFDLAMLPIWRGGSLSFLASMNLRLASTDITDGLHASPAHAVALHKDIRSLHSLGMHFATFAGSDVEAFEPITELMDATKKENIGEWYEEGGFSTIDVGATAVLPVTPAAKLQLAPMVSPAPT